MAKRKAEQSISLWRAVFDSVISAANNDQRHGRLGEFCNVVNDLGGVTSGGTIRFASFFVKTRV